MAAPGRACSRQTTEVNFPDIVENSFTQQEETKPRFRDSKNRLLLSQVAYFQNYQLKTDKDRKDDEKQKYRDSKNTLFLSQVAYYLGCRLKTEVSGFLCCAPKVNMVASGRPPFRRIPEENITEGIEKSGSQQEENKPNVGASKNRLLLSQVAYFQNYRMKTDKDREDDDEEWIYGDSKNKLLVSQAVYYLSCQLKTEFPGFPCSAPNVITVASGRAVAGTVQGVNVPEAIEKSCSQWKDNKPVVGVRRNRCLLSEVDYSLNYRLRTYEAREDDDEEWRYGDSKNKPFVSQVVYYLVCQLKMEVPGFPCLFPNVITVASGRAVAGKIPGVNVPKAIEKSCFQREDNKPDVGVRRNRCLLSEVDYSLNYRLRAYEDREDDDERRYGDNKNKFLVSRAVYYLSCQLKTEVPGFPCSAPNVITVASGRAVAGTIPGVNVPEAIEKSCSQWEDNKPDVRVRRNRCLLSEVNYSLNYRLRTYGTQEDDDGERRYGDSKNKLFVSQVVYYLACQLKMEVPGFPCSAPNVITVASGRAVAGTVPGVNIPEAIEKSCSQREDNKPDVGVRRNKFLLREVDYSLNYRLRTYENAKDMDEDVHVVEAEKIWESPAPREVQKLEVKKVPEDSLEECVITHSKNSGPTDTSQPHGDTSEIIFEEESVNSVLFVQSASSDDVAEDVLIILTEDRKDHNEELKYRDSKKKLLMCQVAYYLACRLKTEVPGFLCSAPPGKPPFRKYPEVNLPEGIEKFCSQQEEKKPNVGAQRKNRLPLSLVAYFLKYRLKSYKDRKDHDEEQKYRDCKKKLLMCQVAYYLGCRLKTEVPGFLCSAPPGKPPFRKYPEVNFPEGIERFCSQQEEKKPNVGAHKNRLPLSLVAYFLKYRLKSYKDRKDHDEEQKYRDCKKKLLMCQVAYYLGCRLKTEVPGFLCSAPPGKPPFRKYPEVNLPEGIEKFCSQQEEKKPNVGAQRKNRLPLSLVAYFLKYRLKSYKDRKDHDEEQKYRDCKKKLLMCQVAYYLGCRLKTEVPGFLCSAPPGKPPFRKYPEVNLPEGIEKFCSQQEEKKPNVGAQRKNRLPLSLVAYFLKYRLKSYKIKND
uniref:uncharacterized protein LOC103788993 isoform X1 n=1 Tax=Callithrix jacchus TaxID=9483 RepID=UPI0023DCF7DF|nr:uncharacterized protein LOC103788993 isoform X1 [Callithrix jacchus]XP_035135727.2 uncharacterized protein LOC103788993 isoform X1 [Callithrix jacchus]XP_035135728.2 uncharacterized protein LOC103788993 isoform X1 [Callithrix jacchus]XP_035135729.2 uncharacterized protein LOC103788993 isoform X1 [Callithrix jacchus]XP_035135730.2 uncharacterized protein LOC103788993 isoform X1 [Callithrix jacchus]XP_035135733.2 uncharacterized protein LOC103788993 isoform X1 [Callithrix jacchus]XP_03513573